MATLVLVNREDLARKKVALHGGEAKKVRTRASYAKTAQIVAIRGIFIKYKRTGGPKKTAHKGF